MNDSVELYITFCVTLYSSTESVGNGLDCIASRSIRLAANKTLKTNSQITSYDDLRSKYFPNLDRMISSEPPRTKYNKKLEKIQVKIKNYIVLENKYDKMNESYLHLHTPMAL